jgi:hypothetical protein
MPFKGKQAKGGARKGAGRKPTAYTQLRKRLENEKIEDAEAAFDFYVQVLNNPNEPTAVRMAAADRIQDRILGKAMQRGENEIGEATRALIEKFYASIGREQARGVAGSGLRADTGGAGSA